MFECLNQVISYHIRLSDVESTKKHLCKRLDKYNTEESEAACHPITEERWEDQTFPTFVTILERQ